MQKFILPQTSAIMTDVGYVQLNELESFDKIYLLNGDLRKPQVLKKLTKNNIKEYHLKSRHGIPLCLNSNSNIFSNHTKYYTNTQYFNSNDLNKSDSIKFITSNYTHQYKHQYSKLFWKIIGMCILKSDIQFDGNYNNTFSISLTPQHLNDFNLIDTLIEMGFKINEVENLATTSNSKLIDELMFLKELPEFIFNLKLSEQKLILEGVVSFISTKNNGKFKSNRIYSNSWAKIIGLHRLALNSNLDAYINLHTSNNVKSNGYILTVKYTDLQDPFLDHQNIDNSKDEIKEITSTSKSMIQFIINSDSPIIVDNYLLISNLR